MAEFLIYNKDHWMDIPSKQRSDLTGYKNVEQKILADSRLTIEQRTKDFYLHEMKYTARYQREDIVEARRDNGPRGKLEEESFIFLQVPGINLKDAKQYIIPDVDLSNPDNPVIIKRRKYYVNIAGLMLDEHQNVSLTNADFNSRLKVKK